MHLFHYFDKSTGPFKNLSDLSIERAEAVLSQIRRDKPTCQSARRDEEYLNRRVLYENIVRKLFDGNGGIRHREYPQYMVVERCDWLFSWYESPSFIKIPITEFDIKTLSFTYGDMHPTFSPIVTDGREYRNKIYTYDEILEIIDRYGLPQYHEYTGEIGFPRYVEVQVWSDDAISKYLDKKYWLDENN